MTTYTIYRERSIEDSRKGMWVINCGQGELSRHSFQEPTNIAELARIVVVADSFYRRRIKKSDKITTIPLSFVPLQKYVREPVGAFELAEFWRVYDALWFSRN